MNLARTYSSVSQFYAGKSVFITGGTGFVGKVLTEKLLYSCPQVENVYLLLRNLKNQSAEQRLKTMIDSPVFSRLKAEKPEVLKKLVPVRGELTAANLDISDKDFQILRNNVSIVIHSAATVKFTEPLKTALAINYEGTRNVLELCKRLKHCDAFVHVSSAYAISNRKVVEEKIYPALATSDEAYDLVEKESRSEDITANLKGLPNPYTFAKALAENLVADSHGEVPTVIVRPSIVGPSKSEPVPGWVDNWFGATALLSFGALGICRTCYTEYDYNLDLIPVDYVSNLILVAATKADRSNDVAIFNACSGFMNPVSIGDATKFYVDAGVKDEFNMLPFPNFILFSKQRWLVDAVFKLMYIMAYGADIVLQAVGEKSKYQKFVNRSIDAEKILSFFTANSWLMKTPNALGLSWTLSAEDLHEFPCNPQDIDWKEYIQNYYRGVKKYLIEKPKM